uniref:Uncharacterized protein n=1 Tax=Schlesneria paludicola TaxID=360056 RepID=A0A7C4LPB8_9PLAN
MRLRRKMCGFSGGQLAVPTDGEQGAANLAVTGCNAGCHPSMIRPGDEFLLLTDVFHEARPIGGEDVAMTRRMFVPAIDLRNSSGCLPSPTPWPLGRATVRN